MSKDKDNTGLLIIILILGSFVLATGTLLVKKNIDNKFISEMASKGYQQVLVDKQIVWQKVKQEANVQ